jgi:hypothetical protein
LTKSVIPNRSAIGFFAGIDVDAHDLVGPREPQPLDDVEADAPEAEDDRARPDLDLGGVDHRADARGHAAADVADLVERRVGPDLRKADLGQDRVVGEGRAAHVMQDRIAIERREARGAVRHQALALGRAHLLAEVGFRVQAVFAFPAFGGVERDDMIAGLQAGHALADLQHDASALMAEDGGEQPLGIGARKREIIGVADAGGLDLDQNLARRGHRGSRP